MVDGAKVGLLFDNETNGLVGHAPWREVDDEPAELHVHNYYVAPPTPEEIQAQREHDEAIEALITLVLVAAVKATPHVRRWVNEKAVAPVRSAWERRSVARKAKRGATDDVPSLEREVTFIASATGVEIAVPATEIRMSRAEWDERVRAMEAAGAFRDEQLRILASARIEGDVVSLDTPDAAEQLTAAQFGRSIGLLPAGSPPLFVGEAAPRQGTVRRRLGRRSVERSS